MNAAHLHVLYVNRTRYEIELPKLIGLQVRALAAIPSDYTLVLEGAGDGPDRLLGDEDTVSLEQGPVRIFTTVQATFG